MSNARKHTNRLLQMLDDGLIDAESVVNMCLGAMSDADVGEMMDSNELSERFVEDDGQPDEDQEWHDFDPDC